MCQLRYLESLDLGLREAILLLVHLDPQVPLLGRLVIACVNDEVILPLDLRAIPLEVVVEDPVQVHVQTHEFRQRLLTHKSLRLQVHLGYRLGRQATEAKQIRDDRIILLDFLPAADPEFHQGDLQDLYLLLGPAG
jgi:hypothetical protein